MMLFLCLLLVRDCFAADAELVVSVFAGESSGNVDGQARNAKFMKPVAIVIDSEAHVGYVSDEADLRKLYLPHPDWIPDRTASGVSSRLTTVNYQLNPDRKHECYSLCLDSAYVYRYCLAQCNGCYMTDALKVPTTTPHSTCNQFGRALPFVTTLVSSSKTIADGHFSEASFSTITSMTLDADLQHLYIASAGTLRLANLETEMVSTTFSSSRTMVMTHIQFHEGLVYATSTSNNEFAVLVFDTSNGALTHLSGDRFATGTVVENRPAHFPSFQRPAAMTVDAASNTLFVLDSVANKVRGVHLGVVTSQAPPSSCAAKLVYYVYYTHRLCGLPTCGDGFSPCHETEEEAIGGCTGGCLGYQRPKDSRFWSEIRPDKGTFDPLLECYSDGGEVYWKSCGTDAAPQCNKLSCGLCQGPCKDDVECAPGLKCLSRIADSDNSQLLSVGCLPGTLSETSNPEYVNVCYNPRGRAFAQSGFEDIGKPLGAAVDARTNRLLVADTNYISTTFIDEGKVLPRAVQAWTAGLAMNSVTGVMYGTSSPPEIQRTNVWGVYQVQAVCADGETDCGAGRWCDKDVCQPCKMQGGVEYLCGVNNWRSGAFCDGLERTDQTCAACSLHGGEEYLCGKGQLRTGESCAAGVGWADQTCGPCPNWVVGAGYVCPQGSRQTGVECSGETTSNTQTCQECNNGGAAYTCPMGYRKTGTVCTGESSLDTQKCMLCTYGTSYTCPTSQYRSGSFCLGDSTEDTQKCKETSVRISLSAAAVPEDTPMLIGGGESMEIEVQFLGQQDHYDGRLLLQWDIFQCLENWPTFRNAAVFPSAHQFACTAPPGTGENHEIQVSSLDMATGTAAVLWSSTTWLISHPRPTLTTGTLHLASDAGFLPQNATIDLLVDPPATTSVVFSGTNLGTNVNRVKVTFLAPTPRPCEVYYLQNDEVRCTVVFISGYSLGMPFRVDVGSVNHEQTVDSVDTLRYPSTPNLIASAGCGTVPTIAEPWTVDCNTQGGYSVTLIGQDLCVTTACGVVTVGGDPYSRITQYNGTEVAASFPGFDVSNLQAITFDLSAGQGVRLALSVGQGNYFSGAGPILSYSAPLIINVTGDCDGLNGVVDCARAGGNRLMLTGTNFGAERPKVVIGCHACDVDTFSHTAVTCITSFGFSTQLIPKLTQAKLGTFASATQTVSYFSCGPGTYVDGSDCLPCAAGTFSDSSEAVDCQPCPLGSVSNASQHACSDCPAGTRSVNNASLCMDCGPGLYSSATSLECSLCPLGRANNVSRAETCERCSPGKFQGDEGQSQCTPCPIGKYTSGAESTVCQDCIKGYVALFPGLDLCSPCAPGTRAHEGEVCESCPVGTFSGTAAPACEACITGTVSGSGARSCDTCPAGTHSSESADTCIPCSAGKFAQVPKSKFCIACEAGTFAVGNASVCEQCAPGTFSEEGASSCTACDPGRSSETSGSASCARCARTFFAPTNGSEFCSPCVPDSIADENRTDCLCNPSFYRAERTTPVGMAVYCKACAPGADCVAQGITKATITSIAGWSASRNVDEDLFLRCPRAASCEASNQCADGYAGPLCASCAKGFGRRGGFECGLCTSNTLRIFAILGMALVALVVAVFMVWKTRKGALSGGHFSVVLKVLFSALQFNGMAAVIQFNWADDFDFLKALMQLSNDLATLGSSFISMECMLEQNQSLLRPFEAKSLVFLFAPLLIPCVAAPAVVGLVYVQKYSSWGKRSEAQQAEALMMAQEEEESAHKARRAQGGGEEHSTRNDDETDDEPQPHQQHPGASARSSDNSIKKNDLQLAMVDRNGDGDGEHNNQAANEYEGDDPAHASPQTWKLAKDYFATACVVLLFIVHPSLTRTALQMFKCKLVTGPGPDERSYLLDDMQSRCWTSTHYLWAFLVSTPMFVLYALGIPAVYSIILYRNRTKLDQARTARKYSFLYKGYRKKVYYWESIIFMRKVLVGCVVVFWSESPRMQGLMAIFLVTTSSFAHIYVMPFDTPMLNLLEFVSLAMSCFTFLCGQMTFADKDSLWTQFFAVMAVVFVFVFLSLCVYLLARETIIRFCEQRNGAKHVAHLGKEQDQVEMQGEEDQSPQEQANEQTVEGISR